MGSPGLYLENKTSKVVERVPDNSIFGILNRLSCDPKIRTFLAVGAFSLFAIRVATFFRR